MTILHVADLHFHKRWFNWLSNRAPSHDLLVVAGDLLDLNHPASHRVQVEWISSWIRAYGRPLALCSGNHDLVWDSKYNVFWPARWLSELASERVWVDGQAANLGGIQIYLRTATGSIPLRTADIWVTHAPALGATVGWCDRGRAGGDPRLTYELLKYEPSLVLCGHVHQPLSWIDHFQGSLHLNPGCDPAARFPNHILIEFDESRVRRVRDHREDNVVVDLAGLPRPSPSPRRAAALPLSISSAG